MMKLGSKLAYDFRRFIADRTGTTAVEYAVIAGGIAVAIAASVTLLGTRVVAFYDSVIAIF